MTYVPGRHALAAALLLTGILPATAQGSESQGSSCSAVSQGEQTNRSKLGSFLSVARNSGLLGSAMGAVRGDGNLKSDIAGAAKAAATDVAVRAASGCVSATGVAASGSAGAASATVQESAATNRSGSVHPVRASAARTAKYPHELPKPADFAATKAVYDDFGKVACMSCEGGYAYDGWAAFPRDEYSSKYNGEAQRIGSWPVGHVHRWKGNESTGTLTVVAGETVGGFRCRTLRYRLTKGSASVERPGLICWARANSFAGSESWNEVY